MRSPFFISTVNQLSTDFKLSVGDSSIFLDLTVSDWHHFSVEPGAAICLPYS